MKTYPSRLAMIQELPPGAIGVEVGVYRGDFSLEVLSHTQVSHLYLVDPWVRQADYKDTINEEDQEGHMRETLRKVTPFVDGRRCSVIRGFSAKVANDNTHIPLLDFAFIDAYHAYEAALEDITLWSKRLKPTGVLFAHDYFEGPSYGHDGHVWYSGVVKACADFCAENGWEVTGISAEALPTAKLERKK
jgi:hypothetical protein